LRAELDRLAVHRVAELLELSPAQLGRVAGLERLHAGARALREGRPVVLKQPSLQPGPHAFVHLTRDPFLDRTLCYGVLHADGRYASFPAPQPDAEPAARAACQRELWAVEGPLFHLGGCRPAHLLGEGHEAGPPVDHRLVDLRAVLRGAVVFPTRGMSPRELAPFFKGFEDVAERVEGLAAVSFDRYQRTGDRQHLDQVLEWNERELRLLRTIHSYLLEVRALS
jgi:predicted RecB family nuclease